MGTALTNTLLDRAKEAGYKALTLWTASPLISAIRHYEKMGFRRTEQKPNTSWSLTGDTVYKIKMDLNMAENDFSLSKKPLGFFDKEIAPRLSACGG